jgi:DNA-binding NarL/FixJ family response regulator
VQWAGGVEMQTSYTDKVSSTLFTSEESLLPTVSNTFPEKSLLIVNSQALERECLAQALIRRKLGLHVLDCVSLEEWRSVQDQYPPLGAVLYNLGSRKATEVEETNKILKLTAQLGKIPVVILAETDEFAQVLKVLEIGVRGYIPTSVDISVCVEAIELAVVGGTFIPASSIVAVKHLIESNSTGSRELSDIFTPRQADVVMALRKGKANKIIAYELELRESTVKVHIRNIMKKLKATNRTEVVYKINDIYPPESSEMVVN